MEFNVYIYSNESNQGLVKHFLEIYEFSVENKLQPKRWKDADGEEYWIISNGEGITITVAPPISREEKEEIMYEYYQIEVNRLVNIDILNQVMFTETEQGWFDELEKPSKGLQFLFQFMNRMYQRIEIDFICLGIESPDPYFRKYRNQLCINNEVEYWGEAFSDKRLLQLLTVPYKLINMNQ